MQASNAVAWHSTASPFGNVEGIHLKSRRIEDGTLYAESRGRGSKLKKGVQAWATRSTSSV
jgi:hypothetical protein